MAVTSGELTPDQVLERDMTQALDRTDYAAATAYALVLIATRLGGVEEQIEEAVHQLYHLASSSGE